MFNLALRSAITLIVLFGILFAVITAVLVYLQAPVWLAVIVVLVIAGLQYLISPYIIEWIYKIEWQPPEHVDQGIATSFGRSVISRACASRSSASLMTVIPMLSPSDTIRAMPGW